MSFLSTDRLYCFLGFSGQQEILNSISACSFRPSLSIRGLAQRLAVQIAAWVNMKHKNISKFFYITNFFYITH